MPAARAGGTGAPAGRPVLLRPDQAAAAVLRAEGGSEPSAIAAALGVPLDVVVRSLRRPEPPPTSAEAMPEPMVGGPVLVVGPRLSVRHLLRPERWRAPVWVEDDLSWPPMPVSDDRWVVLPVREGRDRVRTALREVVLWDARVLVDDGRRVLCPMCVQLVEVVEMGRNLYGGQDGLADGGIPSHVLGLPSRPSAP